MQSKINWEEFSIDQIMREKDANGNRYLQLFLIDYSQKFDIQLGDLNAGCPNCIADYYKKFNTKIMKNSCKDYKLKAKYEGIQLEFGSSFHVTNANLTDEIAKSLLKNHPAGENLFEKFVSLEEVNEEQVESQEEPKEVLPAQEEPEKEISISPGALKASKKFGITSKELKDIIGTGKEGKIIDKDVKAYYESLKKS